MSTGHFTSVSKVRTTLVLPCPERKQLAQVIDGICVVSGVKPTCPELSSMFLRRGKNEGCERAFRSPVLLKLEHAFESSQKSCYQTVLISKVWDRAQYAVLLTCFRGAADANVLVHWPHFE